MNQNGGIWSVGPVAPTMWDQPGGFIEAGNQKRRDDQGNWRRVPYWSYVTNTGRAGGNAFWYLDLVPASYYKYSIYPTGAQDTFQIRLCYNVNYSTCVFLEAPNMGRNSYNHVGTGGEGNCAAQFDPRCPIGYIASRTSRFLFLNNPTWYPYCYTSAHNNVAWDGGHISACRAGIDSPDWTINYK